jgi:mono/diheme cytochrome c family protein
MPRSVLAALAMCAVASGCEWFSTMSDPVSIQPHEREPLMAPDHAVPLNGLPQYDLATAEAVLPAPRPANERSIAVGESYYQAFCAVCHGDRGLGDGAI